MSAWRMPRRHRALGVLLALCAVTVGCRSSVRDEAERALVLGEKVRTLEVESQHAAAEGLAQLTCRDADVCRVKETCLTVATATLAGLNGHRELQDLGALPEAERLSPEIQAKADVLHAEASANLTRGREAVASCETAMVVLERSKKGK